MLIRLLEHLVISKYNAWADRFQAAARPDPSASSIPENFTILGHLLPDEAATPDPQTIARLTDAGTVALSPEARRKHLYILGATGTGKTNLLLRFIESDIRHKRAFCVFDLRGDLVDRVLDRLPGAAPLEEWSKRLLLLDLRQDEHVVPFNPLCGEGDAHSRAGHVLSVLRAQSDSWGVQLDQTLHTGLVALAETGWTLLEMEPLLTSSGFRSQVLSQVTDTRVKSFFGRYNGFSPSLQMNWATAALNKVSPLLNSPSLRLLFGQRQSVPLRALLDKEPGMIILVALSVDRLHEAAKLTGGLLVSSLQHAVFSRHDVPERERVPVNLYVDEFESMASDRFQTIVSEGRRFGLGLTLSHQNVSQLSTELKQVLRNNVHTQVYFQTGAIDAADLSREISSGRSDEEVRRKLMSQPPGQAFLVRRGLPSARMQVLHTPDPTVPSHRVKEVCRASWNIFARPRAEVESELRDREQSFDSPVPSSASPTQPVYVITHSKSAQFKPEPTSPENSASPSTAALAAIPTPDSSSPSIAGTASGANNSEATDPPTAIQDVGNKDDADGTDATTPGRAKRKPRTPKTQRPQ